MNSWRQVTRSTVIIAGFGLLSASALAAGFVVHNQQVVPRTGSGFAPAAVRGARGAPPAVRAAVARPLYDLDLRVNYGLLTWDNTARVTVPDQGEALRDVALFLYANSDGVGGATRQHPNVQVESVKLGGQTLRFTLDGAVLHVQLPQPQRGPFTLEFVTHGVVPRAPEGAGGISDMLGGGGDISGMLGGLGGQTQETTKAKDKNTDYGLYTFGNGVLSLGSFWYPALAVRQNGRWVDDAPEGLGDVGYSVMSDFNVSINTPNTVQIAATGNAAAPNGGARVYQAQDVRDFAVLMSQDWVVNQKVYNVGGKPVNVTAYTLKKDAAQAGRAIDIAGNALQIYDKRFGSYLYGDFKVVQGPIRSGAGGMEFSGMTSIAQGLYGDMQKELGNLANSLGANLGMGGGPQADALKDLLGEDGDGLKATAAQTEGDDGGGNPAQDMLNGLLGGQAAMMNSLLEETIAHEVAHQWWAMAVGSDSIRAPWLDEALTNYSSMIYWEDRYGAAKAAEMRDTHLKQPYSLARMMGAPDGPANLKTADYSNNLQYGALVYGKAALFYQALREKMGDVAFFGALRDYYRDETNQLSNAGDLLAHFEQRAPGQKAAIRALYQRWILGSSGDEDVAGGKISGIGDMLGGLLGGGAGGDE